MSAMEKKFRSTTMGNGSNHAAWYDDGGDGQVDDEPPSRGSLRRTKKDAVAQQTWQQTWSQAHRSTNQLAIVRMEVLATGAKAGPSDPCCRVILPEIALIALHLVACRVNVPQ